MYGTIYKQKGAKKQKWVYKSPPFGPDKKRIRKAFETEEEAQAFRNQFKQSMGRRTTGENIPGLTIQEAYEKWSRATFGTEKYYSHNTQTGFRSYFKKHILPILGNKKMENCKFKEFNLYLITIYENGLRYSTISHIIAAVKELFKYAEKQGWIIQNTTNEITTPQRDKEKEGDNDKIINTIALRDFQKVRDYLIKKESVYYYIISFLAYSGLRIEEAIALQEKNANMNKSTLLVRHAAKMKNKPDGTRELVISPILKSDAAYRKVTMSANLQVIIAEALAYKADKGFNSPFLFVNSAGQPHEKRNVLRAFQAALKACNIDKVGLHSLRKLFCKILKDSGADWEEVRRIMGHSSVEMSQQIYYQLDDEQYENLANNIPLV